MKLEGIRVLDLSLFLPGPTVTQMMADQGAEVIKIEDTRGGEPNRHIGQRRSGVSVYFEATHRGKKSLTLNLKAAAGRDIFLQLARKADVVLESFRPGVVERLGIDYDAIVQFKPDIIYASLSAYGQTGPLSQIPAHDLAVEANCGLLSNNVDRDGKPCIPAMPSGDMLSATLTLSGILMALLRKQKTGQGDYLDVAMMDAIFACMPNSVGAVFAEKTAPEPHSERIWGGNAMYRIYATADDKHIVLGGAEVKFARNLLHALHRPDLLPLCEKPPGAAQLPVVEFFEATFATRSQAQWVAFLQDLDVCFAPVNDLRQGFDLAQTRARAMLVTDETGKEHIGNPLKFRREPAAVCLHAPGYGEHNDEILRDLGFREAEIARLRREGVISAR